VIASHRIENDFAGQLRLELRLTSHKTSYLALFYCHHFATFIKAAFWANAVGQAGLTAIRAQRGLGSAQSIVRASFVATSFGMSSFWIWHNYSILIATKSTKGSKEEIKHLCFSCLLWLL
jgi:hypothetical protein